MTLDNAITSRDNVNTSLRQVLDDATDKWGVRVVRVEIQRIDPPTDVMDAMHEQMKAERTRRAVVLEADGSREAAIAIAEGQKQAAILSAEGIKQEAILTAEGEAATPPKLVLEKFEVGGVTLLSPHAPIELPGVASDSLFGCTMFCSCAIWRVSRRLSFGCTTRFRRNRWRRFQRYDKSR